ncbi:MAG: thiopurine S-methyltransferase [Polyangiaceae bacterium]
MESEFWHRRWAEGRTGFHEGKPNHFLQRFIGRYGAPRRVLVPLCGKTEDLAFLAQHGHQVFGVELSEMAARAFFSEHDLRPRERRSGDFSVFEAQNVCIAVGDYFQTTSALLPTLDALYDRAAMVALPEGQRLRYVEHTRSLLSTDAVGLLVTFEYEPGTRDGPPFSVPEPEVRAAWSGTPVEALAQQPAEGPSFGVGGAVERCYWIG